MNYGIYKRKTIFFVYFIIQFEQNLSYSVEVIRKRGLSSTRADKQ